MMRNIFSYYAIAIALMTFFVNGASAQTPSQRGAVQLSASVQTAGPSITLEWPVHSGANSYSIYRRTPGATSWGSVIGTAAGSSTSYVDNTVIAATAYEYKVRRSGNGTGYGYLRSGIEVPATDMHYRGKMILLVEDSVGVQLAVELAQLEDDLVGDGWYPIRIDVNATDNPPAVKAQILSTYNADPNNVKALYIIGKVPVPYSGNDRPDGHSEHRGAWACDGYYGELTSTWTDNSVNSTGALTPWNHNQPGDGKFDQTDFPSNVELMVGRVHLGELPAFPQTEVQLLADYLNRAHAFKLRWWEAPATGVIHDNLSWVSNPLAASGYTSIAAMVGAANITDVNVNAEPWSNHSNVAHLVNYHSGSGAQSNYLNNTTFVGINGGGNTADLVNTSNGSVFNMSFGSYFGDWDNYNNYLRALIANGNGLVSVWSGQPNWFLHPLAMGEPVGYSARLAMNNTNSNYSPQNGGWWGQNYSRIHLGLMGDPSLRMRMVAPPTQAVATNSSWFVDVSWTASPDSVIGYYVYRIDDVNGVVEQISPLVTGTSFTSSTVQFVQGERYMVRAATLQTTASGSFENLSIGSIAIGNGTQIADCAGVVGGNDIPGQPCDDSDPTTGNDTWDANCQCVGIQVDCNGVAGGASLPGTPCNDNDPNTGNDTWDSNCDCVGILIDCEGVIGGPALPGIACDDNDPGTGNDVWTTNCICQGEVIDCLGIVGGPALPGSVCDDGDSTTVNDVWTSTCVCEGISTGIDEVELLIVKVHPNPSEGLFMVRSNALFKGRLQIVDMSGRSILQRAFSGDRVSIDLRDSSAGVYLLKLFDSKGGLQAQERLIVQ